MHSHPLNFGGGSRVFSTKTNITAQRMATSYSENESQERIVQKVRLGPGGVALDDDAILKETEYEVRVDKVETVSTEMEAREGERQTKKR
jgi:hypothetical protein